LFVLVLLAAFAFLVVRILRRPEPLADLAVPLSLAAAIAVSMVVNDSPTDVLLVGTTGLAAAMAGMLRGPWPASAQSFSLSPLSSSSQGAAAPRMPRPRPRP
jgi:hypothetical protein